MSHRRGLWAWVGWSLRRAAVGRRYSAAVLSWMNDHQAWLWAAGVASVVVFLVSLILVPIVVARIPADYFAHETRPPGLWADRHHLLRWTIRIGKNVLGALLILAGLAMLVLPGQGLLTMIVGFLMLDFPGKYRLEKRMVRIGWVGRAIGWLRRRRGVGALLVEGEGEGEEKAQRHGGTEARRGGRRGA